MQIILQNFAYWLEQQTGDNKKFFSRILKENPIARQTTYEKSILKKMLSTKTQRANRTKNQTKNDIVETCVPC